MRPTTPFWKRYPLRKINSMKPDDLGYGLGQREMFYSLEMECGEFASGGELQNVAEELEKYKIGVATLHDSSLEVTNNYTCSSREPIYEETVQVIKQLKNYEAPKIDYIAASFIMEHGGPMK